MQPAAHATRILVGLAIVASMVLPINGASSQTADPEPQSEKKATPEKAKDKISDNANEKLNEKTSGKVDEKIDDKIYRKEDGIVMPKPIYIPEPDFSDHARKKKIQGTVKLAGYVGTDGAFHDVHITQPLEKSLDDNALAATERWKFHPCTKDGRPVNCHLEVEIGFHLR
jgi:TonB family protein